MIHTFVYLSDAGDDADPTELLDEVVLRDGRGQAGHINAIVVAFITAFLATVRRDCQHHKQVGGWNGTKRINACK